MAQQVLLNVVRQAPEQFGHEQSRWTLAAILRSCGWLNLRSLGGLSQLLERLHIRPKRGRAYLHSPDPDYAAKVAYIQTCLQQARAQPERYVFVYLDEVGYERQPSLAPDYEQMGHVYPLARRTIHSNSLCRGLGALNAFTGQVTYRQAARITAQQLAAFHALLVQTYPHAEVIYVAQDNWPVHVHPTVLAGLQPQTSPFWPSLPATWLSTPAPQSCPDPLPIQLLFLPTYAPWLNPIEKLWRWLKQTVIHLHRSSDDWPALQQRVLAFMHQFEHGSTTLLHYVGLLPY